MPPACRREFSSAHTGVFNDPDPKQVITNTLRKRRASQAYLIEEEENCVSAQCKGLGAVHCDTDFGKGDIRTFGFADLSICVCQPLTMASSLDAAVIMHARGRIRRRTWAH
jgi:hypothetical protein